MEIILTAILIPAAVALASVNFISGFLATPENFVYLGTVHWPGDYFYYLSQFAQGKYSWFFSHDLYTSDFPAGTGVGWVNVFLGRLFYTFGIGPAAAYQICTAVFAAGFLILSYFLIREIFPDDKWKRMAAFALFVFNNAFPRIISEGGKLTLSYFDYWFNNGLPFNRLASVPHQLLAKASLVLIFITAIKWHKNGIKRHYVMALALAGLVLASTEPVHWLLAVAVLAIAGFLPVIAVILSGMPVFVYLRQLFLEPPYSQLAAWELSQSVYVGFFNFLAGNGPAAVLAIPGMFLLFKRKTFATRIAVIFSAVTLFLFLSRIPVWLGVVNVRFLPALTTLFMAAAAVEAVFAVPAAIGRMRRRAVIAAGLGLILLLNILPLLRQVPDRVKTNTANAYYYLDIRAMATYLKATQISDKGDVFLVMWPFNSSFPAYSARRSYNGHHLLTINSAVKDSELTEFFYGDSPPFDMKKFLNLNNIKYVIAYPWLERIDKQTFLNKEFDNEFLAIYRVLK